MKFLKLRAAKPETLVMRIVNMHTGKTVIFAGKPDSKAATFTNTLCLYYCILKMLRENSITNAEEFCSIVRVASCVMYHCVGCFAVARVCRTVCIQCCTRKYVCLEDWQFGDINETSTALLQ